MTPFSARAVRSLCSLAVSLLFFPACATIDKVDQVLSRQSQSRPPVSASAASKNQAPKTDEAQDKIVSYLSALEKQGNLAQGGAFSPESILFLVNGHLLADDTAQLEIEVVPESKIEIKIFNGGSQSLDRAEIGFFAEGARYSNLGAWETDQGSAWYWCRAPINPSSYKAEPLAYFTTANSFTAAFPSGKRLPAVVRLKSFNKPEIARRFILKVY